LGGKARRREVRESEHDVVWKIDGRKIEEERRCVVSCRAWTRMEEKGSPMKCGRCSFDDKQSTRRPDGGVEGGMRISTREKKEKMRR
jgi:hypothetical protein